MQSTQKLSGLLFVFLTCCVFSLHAQHHYTTLVQKEGEIPVIDAVRLPSNTFDVARFPDAYLNFPCAVQTGSEAKEILAAYIKTDSVRSISLTRSLDGGHTWREEPFTNHWDGSSFRSLSLFNLGTSYISRRTKGHPRNSLMLFSGGNPIMVSSSYTNGEQWCNFYPANNFGGFRISGMIRLKDGRHMALFHDDGRFLYHGEENQAQELRKSSIYKMYSADGGLTWSEPQIALKHNLYGLYDAVVLHTPSGPRKDRGLIMIVSERETSTAFISYSDDDGQSWSYPSKLPPQIQGDRFGIATFNRQLIIVFRDMCRSLNDGSPNPTFGDLVMWSGDLRELTRGNRNGIKVRIADNYPVSRPVDYNDRKFFECGYVSVIPVSRQEVSVIAYGRWEEEALPYIRSFIIRPKEIRAYAKNL